MVIDGQFPQRPDFPRQQSAETIARIIKKKCDCELCKLDALVKKRNISRRLSEIARSSSPEAEALREKLIEEIISL